MPSASEALLDIPERPSASAALDESPAVKSASEALDFAPEPSLSAPAYSASKDQSEQDAERADVDQRLDELEPKTPEYLAAKEKYAGYNLEGRPMLSSDNRPAITDPKELKKLRDFQVLRLQLSAKAGSPEARAYKGIADSTTRAAFDQADDIFRDYPFSEASNQAPAPETGFWSNLAGSTAKMTGNAAASLFDMVGDNPEEKFPAGNGPEVEDSLPAYLREIANDKAMPFYGGNERSTNTMAQLGRGAGMVLSTVPTMALGGAGLPAAVLQLSGGAYEEAKSGREQELRDAGMTDPDEIRTQSDAAGQLAGAKSLPGLALYMIGGKVAAKFAGRLMGEEASVTAKTLAGTGAATVSNVGTGAVLRAVEAEKGHRLEAATPSIENLTADTLFGVLHGHGVYSEASAKAKMASKNELMRRGFSSEEIWNAPAEMGQQAAEPPAQAILSPDSRAYFDDQGNLVLMSPEGEQRAADQKAADLLAARIEPALPAAAAALRENPAAVSPTPAPPPEAPESVKPATAPESGSAPVQIQPTAASSPSLSDQIKAAHEKAKPIADFVQPPPTIDFKDTATGRSYTVQNTREGIAALASKQGVELPKPLLYTPAVQQPDGTVFTGKDHPSAYRAAADSGDASKGKRGYVDEAGNFKPLTLIELARLVEEQKVALPGVQPGKKYRSAAVRTPDGTVHEGSWHGAALDKVSEKLKPFTELGYVTTDGEFIPNNTENTENLAGTDRMDESYRSSLEAGEKRPFSGELEGKTGQSEEVLNRIQAAAAEALSDPVTEHVAQKVENDLLTDSDNTLPPEEPPAVPPTVPPAPDEPTPTGDRGATSIQNAYTDERRVQLGLPPAFAPLRRTFGRVWDDAMAILDKDRDAGRLLSQRLAEKPEPITDTQDALLLHYLTDLENRHDAKVDELNSALQSGDTDLSDSLKIDERKLRDELEAAYDVDKAVGTANARGLNARKMRAKRDFTLARMLANAKAAKGAPLTDMENDMVAIAHAKIQELQQRLDAEIAKQEEKQSDTALDSTVADLVSQVEAESQQGSALGEGDAAAAAGPEEAPGEVTTETAAILIDHPSRPVRASEIASRPELMQFKSGADEAGVTKEDRLTGKFDTLKAGLIQLWEPIDPSVYGLEPGQKYIVSNGHHRVEFGNRSGVEAYNAQILREADGISAEQARTICAELNVADGKGTIYDQAKFLRNYAATHGQDDALEAGRRIGARGRKAASIAFSATDRLYDAFVNQKIDPDAAAAIAAAVPGNEAAQIAGMRAAIAGKSVEFAANRAKAELGRDTNSARSGPVEFDLFGNEVFAEIDAQAERATAEQKRLSEEIRAVRGAANKPELAAKHGVDVKDPEGVKRRIEELEAERERWENWPNHPDLVAITKRPSGAGDAEGKTTPPASADEPDKAEKKGRIKKALEALSSAAEAARARLKQRAESQASGESLFSGPLDPRDLDDYAIIGADLVAKGFRTLGRFTAKLVTDFGEWIRDHAPTIFARSKETHAKATSNRDLGAEREKVVQSMKTRAGEGDTLNDLRGYVRKLALNTVRGGITEREALVTSVHRDLEQIQPGITRRETMDLISGYGDFKALDKEPAKVRLREINGELQQIGKVLDMKGGDAPAATGVEQRPTSDAERHFIKAVNELKKKGGYRITDAATQLKSAVDAIKTRLRNQIKDLEEELAGRKVEKTKRATNMSAEDRAEVEQLTSARDALKERLAELEGPAVVTDEQRIKAAMAATARSIAEVQSRIKAKDFSKSDRTKFTSPELDALRQEYHELEALDSQIIAEKQAAKTSGIEDQIKKLDAKLQAGDLTVAKRKAGLLTPAQEALMAERDAMIKLVNDLRREAAAKPKAQAQLEKVLEQVQELEKRLAAGDIDPKAKGAVTPLSPEAADAMMLRDALRRQVLEERQKAKPVRSKEAIALQGWKTRALRQQADLLANIAKMDNGTYTEPKKKEPIKLDAEGQKIDFDLDQAKKAHNERLVEWRMEQRSGVKNIFGAGIEALNLARAIMTSYDLSGVLRQGGMVSLAHPIRTARAIPDMIRAAWSEQGRHRLEQEILTRPNAHLYRQSKLALTEESSSLNRLEEAYMSRWLKKLKITKDLGGLQHVLNLPLGAVRASERAYSYILNRIRADTFDALYKSIGKSGHGVTIDEAKAISNYINIATGRPSLGATIDKAAPALNAVFFAPKYVASRFMALADMASFGSVSGGSLRVRGAVAKEYARYLVAVGVVAGLYQFMTGRKVETDARSSNFGKLEFGNTHVDYLSGISQAATLLGREASTAATLLPNDPLGQRGRNIKLGSGKFESLHHGADEASKAEKIKYGGSDSSDVLFRFLRTKLSPIIGGVLDATSGQNVVGQPATPGDTAARMVIPLSYGDVVAAMKDEGVAGGTALALAAVLGAGVQNYEAKKPKKKPKP